MTRSKLTQAIAGLLDELEAGRTTRREVIQKLALAATWGLGVPNGVVAGNGFKSIGVNHLSYTVADYAKIRDFYVGLLGMRVRGDTGKQCTLAFGDSFIVVRQAELRNNQAFVDHIAITIDEWDRESVEAELTRRGLSPRPDGESSFLIRDPEGLEVQISADRRRR